MIPIILLLSLFGNFVHINYFAVACGTNSEYRTIYSDSMMNGWRDDSGNASVSQSENAYSGLYQQKKEIKKRKKKRKRKKAIMKTINESKGKKKVQRKGKKEKNA